MNSPPLLIPFRPALPRRIHDATNGSERIKQIRESGWTLPVFVYAGRRAVEKRQERLARRMTELYFEAVSRPLPYLPVIDLSPSGDDPDATSS